MPGRTAPRSTSTHLQRSAEKHAESRVKSKVVPIKEGKHDTKKATQGAAHQAEIAHIDHNPYDKGVEGGHQRSGC